MLTRKLLCAALPIGFTAVIACTGSTIDAPGGTSNPDIVPIAIPASHHFTASPARAPWLDTAGVAVKAGHLVVTGLLNRPPVCFGLTSSATRTGSHVVVRVTVTELWDVCLPIFGQAFDYDVTLSNPGAGTYDVDVLHQVQLLDGRLLKSRVVTQRVRVP